MSDTDQNGPQPVDATVDNQLPTPDPNQSQTAPSLFAQQMAPVVAQQQQNQPSQPQPDPNQVKDAALDQHPAVKQASVLRRVGETLAGNPYKETISPDGAVTREKQPLSTKQLLLGAVANILGGLGQVAERTSDRMQGRAPQPIQPLPSQQAQQQRNQQSEEDFNREQNQKVRQAKIINANLEATRSAFALGKEEDSAKQAAVDNHADDLANWQKAGAVEASRIPSDEIMSKNFDKTKFVAVPDGIVPVFKPDGTRVTNADGVPLSQLTYSVVDGTTQAPLTQDKYDQLAKYGLMQSKEGFKLPEGATISSAQLALMNHKLDLIQQTQREIDEVTDTAKAPKINIAAKIKANPQILSAIEKFHNDGASTEPDNQINNLTASQDPKAKNAAGLMRDLFGNDNLEKYKEARTTRQEQQKLQVASDITLRREKDLATFKQKIGASDGSDSVSNAKSYPNEWVDAKTGMHYNLSDPIYNMVEGGQDPSQLTKRGKNYDANLRRANDYSFARYGKPFDAAGAQEDYKYANQKSTQDTLRLLQSLTGDTNNAGGTLAQLQSQFDALGNTSVPKLNELENWMSKNAGKSGVTNFGATLLGVSDEMGKILGGGVATDSSRNEAREILDKAFSGSQAGGAINAVRGTLANRQNALVANNRYLTKQFGQMNVPGQTVSVSAPNGKVYHFKDQAGANNFKKQAGIQ